MRLNTHRIKKTPTSYLDSYLAGILSNMVAVNRLIVCVFVVSVSVPAVLAQPGGKPDGGQGGPPPALVGVGEVQTQNLQARWEAIGRLREVRRTVVAAEQPGRVVEIPVDEGDHVTATDTVLARIDDIWERLAYQSAEANFKQAQASVAEAQTRLDQAARDRQYLDELLEAASAKPKEVEDAHTTEQAEQARLDKANADLMVAQAELDLSQEKLARLRIVPPFDGIVVQKMTEVGQWVNQGDGVIEIISRGYIDAVVDVPEQLVNHINTGDEVEVMVEPLSLPVTGQIAVINPLGSTAARTFPVKVRLDDRDGQLKPGMSLIAKIPTAERVDVLTVPRDAVQHSAMGTVVWADANGVAKPVPVKVLFGHGQRYAIAPSANGPGGIELTDKMRVVTEGAERLFPGRPLNVVPAKTDGNGEPTTR